VFGLYPTLVTQPSYGYGGVKGFVINSSSGSIFSNRGFFGLNFFWGFKLDYFQNYLNSIPSHLQRFSILRKTTSSAFYSSRMHPFLSLTLEEVKRNILSSFSKMESHSYASIKLYHMQTREVASLYLNKL
jgi:hypothetical protein